MEFDKEIPPLETQFSNLGPAEGVDFCVALGRRKSHVINITKH